MADQGERFPQLPAGENLSCSSSRRRATDATSTPPQNQEELANLNSGQNYRWGRGYARGFFSVLFRGFQHVFLHIVPPLKL